MNGGPKLHLTCNNSDKEVTGSQVIQANKLKTSLLQEKKRGKV